MDADRDRIQRTLLRLKALHDLSRQIQPSLDLISYEHGRYLYENEYVEEAAEVFHRLTLNHPTWQEAWLALGVCEFRQRKFNQAHTSLTVSWMLHPHHPLPLYYLALVNLRIGRLKEARELLQRVLTIASCDPSHFAIEEEAARQLRRLGHG